MSITIEPAIARNAKIEADKAGISVSFLIGSILKKVLANKFEASQYIPASPEHREAVPPENHKPSLLEKLVSGKKSKKKRSVRK